MTARDSYTSRDGSLFTEYVDQGFSVEYRDKSHMYWLHKDGVRTQVTSVTTAQKVLDRAGLRDWAQRVGAQGAMLLARQGELDGVPVEEVVDRLKLFHLDIDSKRDEGGARGTSIHTVLEEYAKIGTVPNVSDFPDTERPYVRALCAWLLKADPTPILVEAVVASPTYLYAGRVDLVAEIGGLAYLIDAKTNRAGRVYDEHHIQAAGYIGALEECGCPVLGGILIGLGEDGTFEEVPCLAAPEDFRLVLETSRVMNRLKNLRLARSRAAE